MTILPPIPTRNDTLCPFPTLLRSPLLAGGVLLLTHDLLDLLQHPKAERQPGVDAGACLADHAGAQHEPVGDDLRLLRGFLQGRHEILRKAHRMLATLKNWRWPKRFQVAKMTGNQPLRKDADRKS